MQKRISFPRSPQHEFQSNLPGPLRGAGQLEGGDGVESRVEVEVGKGELKKQEQALFRDLRQKKLIASSQKIGFGTGAMDPTLNNTTTHWETGMAKLSQRFILIKNRRYGSHLKENY